MKCPDCGADHSCESMRDYHECEVCGAVFSILGEIKKPGRLSERGTGAFIN